MTSNAELHHEDCDYRQSTNAAHADEVLLGREGGEIYPCNLDCTSYTFTTQEGAIFDMAYAECPRCRSRASFAHRHFTTMTSFRCPTCELLYDEPTFDPAEVAFMGEADDYESDGTS